MTNKQLLSNGNAAISEGNYDAFLSLCAEDTEWIFVGGQTLKGKEAVGQWMAKAYAEPPVFNVTNMIAEDDYLTAVGEITMKGEDGKPTQYSYCDVWQFHKDKIVGLKAFVIKNQIG